MFQGDGVLREPSEPFRGLASFGDLVSVSEGADECLGDPVSVSGSGEFGGLSKGLGAWCSWSGPTLLHPFVHLRTIP